MTALQPLGRDRCIACILGSPFPATLRPGACSAVVIAYYLRCHDRSCCELLTESDDPDHPVTVVPVTGRARTGLRDTLKYWPAEQLGELVALSKR